MTDFSRMPVPKHDPTMLEILHKLQRSSPELYDQYVQKYEADYNFHFARLMQAKPEEILRQQGIVAIMNSHLGILKLAK